MQIIRNYFFCCSCHHFRLILERSASESTQDYHFVTVQYCNIQNPGQPLLMDFQEFPVTDFYRPVTVSLVESVARSLTQVRCRAGDHIHFIPVFFIHQLRPARIRLEYGYIRRVNDIRIVDRNLRIPMRGIESLHHFRYTQAEIQTGTPTQTFLLCAGSPCHAAARICGRGKVMYRHLLACITCSRLESPLCGYNNLRLICETRLIYGRQIHSFRNQLLIFH